MNRTQFSQVRRQLGKTQTQMAELLGISYKGIQSFEQGWRKISPAAERELLLLLGIKEAMVRSKRPCWSIKGCSEETRRNCPVWEFNAGNFCWFFSVTLCQGTAPKSWQEKIEVCRKCEVFKSVFDLPSGHGGTVHNPNPSHRIVGRRSPADMPDGV